MPELPEVEVTRRGLEPALRGASIRRVRMGKPLRWPLGVDPGTLQGACFRAPLRRGKYLWLGLGGPDQVPDQAPDEPSDRGGLLIHLGMSGALQWSDAVDPDAPLGPHDHFWCLTDRGTLRLQDPRRFGAVVWSPALTQAPAAPLLARLGVEPLGEAFSGALLHRCFEGRRVAIKQALLAGDVVVGVGNIYCSEALFLAGIDPRTPAGDLGARRCERLARAIQEVLTQAIALGGSSLRDFRSAHGVNGAFQLEARVYGREGEPCRTCGSPVRRLVQGQRASYHCARCQRR